MKHWTPFTYRDFYDIPRIFLVRSNDRLFLFDCPFDSGEDEYGKTFKVYLMPGLADELPAENWERLAGKAEQLLGEIPTSAIEFDQTLRREVDASVLSRVGF